MNNSILIVDGLNYLFRAYFGVPDIIKTKKGFQINAVYGFFAFLREAVKSVNAASIIVVFDAENAVQHKQLEYGNYKSNRKYGDLGMFEQLPIIKNILTLMDIKYIEEDKMEADDLIGSYSKFANYNNCTVYISSNDYDFFQLVSSDIFVLRSFKGQQQLITKEEVKLKFGINSQYYPDFAALLGDKSDNIPGIRGIGSKTARKLINEYETIENLLLNVQNLKIGDRNKISGSSTRLSSNKKIITIDCKPLNYYVPLDQLAYDPQKLALKTNHFLNKLEI